jgi:hypothetical protein
MTTPDIATIQKYNDEQLYSYFVAEAAANAEIWILTDEYGSVMLNTEDEDCVPVWPSQALAEAWASEEWSHCKAEAIALKTWYSRWTPGLEEDGFALVICPTDGQDGLVVYPDDLDAALKKKVRKLSESR